MAAHANSERDSAENSKVYGGGLVFPDQSFTPTLGQQCEVGRQSRTKLARSSVQCKYGTLPRDNNGLSLSFNDNNTTHERSGRQTFTKRPCHKVDFHTVPVCIVR